MHLLTQSTLSRANGACWTALLAGITAGTLLHAAARADEKAKAREFYFTYETTLSDLEPGTEARVWLPVPPNNEDQEVTLEKLPPGVRIDKEPKFGNLILYATVRADRGGSAKLAATYRVVRREVKSEDDGADDRLKTAANCGACHKAHK